MLAVGASENKGWRELRRGLRPSFGRRGAEGAKSRSCARVAEQVVFGVVYGRTSFMMMAKALASAK